MDLTDNIVTDLTVIDKIIEDSGLLLTMKRVNPDEFEFLSDKSLELFQVIEKLNDMFEKGDIIDRAYPLYENIYPEFTKDNETKIIQLMNDLHYLESSKRKDLLVLLFFYPRRKHIIDELIEDIQKEYHNIKHEDTLLETVLSLKCDDIFTFKEFYLTNKNLIYACSCNNSYVVKYIMEHGLEFGDVKIDKNFNFNDAFYALCQFGNFELAKYVWNIIQVEFDDISCFYVVCKHGFLEMAKWVWSISHIDNSDFSFRDSLIPHLCKSSSNNEMIIWLHEILDNYCFSDMMTFGYVCIDGNFEIVKMLVEINIKSDSVCFVDILHGDAEWVNIRPFGLICQSGNLQLVKWIADYLLEVSGKRPYIPISCFEFKNLPAHIREYLLTIY